MNTFNNHDLKKRLSKKIFVKFNFDWETDEILCKHRKFDEYNWQRNPYPLNETMATMKWIS